MQQQPARPGLPPADRRLFVFHARLSMEDAQWLTALEHSSQSFPQKLEQSIRRYRRPRDKYARILSKWLLLKALVAGGHEGASLDHLRMDSFGRPSMEGCRLDFNLSHSGDYVVCAVAAQGRVGIDVEQLREIQLGDFQDILAPSACKRIRSATSRQQAFFREWTRLEAVLKADGRGLQAAAKAVDCGGSTAVLNGKEWHLHEIALDPEYACHVATAMKDAEIVVEPYRWSSAEIQNAAASVVRDASVK
jgi:4'-phosphopantetheinyl transferase